MRSVQHPVANDLVIATTTEGLNGEFGVWVLDFSPVDYPTVCAYHGAFVDFGSSILGFQHLGLKGSAEAYPSCEGEDIQAKSIARSSKGHTEGQKQAFHMSMREWYKSRAMIEGQMQCLLQHLSTG